MNKRKKDGFSVTFLEVGEWPCLMVKAPSGVGFRVSYPEGVTHENITEGQLIDLVNEAKKGLVSVENKLINNKKVAYKAANPRK